MSESGILRQIRHNLGEERKLGGADVVEIQRYSRKTAAQVYEQQHVFPFVVVSVRPACQA